MNSNTYTKQEYKNQYKTAENLNIRFNLHSYNTNKVDWNNWCFSQMQFPDTARILELGCGTGGFWYVNKQYIKKDWTIVLSDFSAGMLESTRKTLEGTEGNFTYAEIDAQSIPYPDKSFDVVIARHMLYLVPEIEQALSEVKRVLKENGTFYVTTNSNDTMAELNALVKEFDSEMGLHTNGSCDRFTMENGNPLLKKYFNQVDVDVLQGKIVVGDAEPMVSYKASSIKGTTVLVGEKREQFSQYLEDHIEKNGNVSITTKSCIFKAQK